MNDEQPILNDVDGDRAWHPSRRDFLRLFGIGGASFVAAGGRVDARPHSVPPDDPLGSLPPTSTPVSEEPGWRQPGGPTVQQLASSLDYDIERIFRHVADEIQYDPYVGVLRGARGTLWSRAGNSADQAVLLAALLNEALVETRFVVGALDDSAAATVLDAAIVDEQTLRKHVAPVFSVSREATADEVAAAATPDNQQVVAELPDRSARIAEASRAQLESGLATITGALAEAAIELPEPVFELPDRERTEHVWVQYAAGAEWIDLDPVLRDTAARQALIAPSATTVALADELRHAVTVTLAAEVISGGAPTRRELITYQAFTEDLVGLPISIGHAKPEGLAAIGANVLGALDGTVQYVPVIVVGDWAEGGDERITFVTGEGIAAVFDESDNEGDTLAEWLEVTISSPDAPPRTVSREIFDRVGYAKRAGGTIDLAAIEPVEFVDIDAETPREFLPLRAVWSLAVTGAGVPWDFLDQDPAIEDLFADLGVISEGYSLIRDALQLEVGAEYGYRYLAGAPNVTAFVAGPSAVTASGAQIETAIDLLARSFIAVPLGGATLGDAHPQHVAGVLSHVAERISRGDWQDNPAPGGEPIGVGRIFEEAARQGFAVRVIGPDASGADELAISEAARLRIAAAVEAGLIVVVPERAVEFGGREAIGWWLVDPTTGATADQFEDGRGVSLTEQAKNLRVSFRAWGGFRRLGGCVGKYGALGAVTLGVGSNYGGNPELVGYALALAQTALESAGDGLGALGC